MLDLNDVSIERIQKKIHSKKKFKNFDQAEIEHWLLQNGFDKYRTAQLFHEIYIKKVNNFSEMSVLPKNIRQKLEESFELTSVSIKKIRTSEDGSVKFLFELNDGKSIEAVYMPWIGDDDKLDRSTLCISTMAGCPVGCAFCATGTLGFKRNLDSAEIIDQVFEVERHLNIKIDNIVLMGMGEPLLNYKQTVKAIDLLTNEKFKVLSRRKITLSTSGAAPRIIELAGEKNPVKLALSLHATTNGLRKEIMPITESFDLKTVLDAIEFYYRNTGMPITYEYIVFKGLNNTDNDVKRLAKIAARVPSKINLIPFNDISFTKPTNEIAGKLYAASKAEMEEFAAKLREKGVIVILRDTFGGDIEAACGQLALSEEKQR